MTSHNVINFEPPKHPFSSVTFFWYRGFIDVVTKSLIHSLPPPPRTMALFIDVKDQQLTFMAKKECMEKAEKEINRKIGSAFVVLGNFLRDLVFACLYFAGT